MKTQAAYLYRDLYKEVSGMDIKLEGELRRCLVRECEFSHFLKVKSFLVVSDTVFSC